MLNRPTKTQVQYLVYIKGDPSVDGACHWCLARKLPVKNNIRLVYLPTRLTLIFL